MVKRIVTMSFILLGVALLCACKGKQQSTIEVSKTDLSSVETVKLERIGKEDEETQNYWDGGGIVTRGEGGYYFAEDNYIYFFDDATKGTTLLCAKADCDHENSNCNAFIGSSIYNNGKLEKSDVYYIESSIYYYKGGLYLLDNNGNLVRFASDGSTREVVANVYVFDSTSGTKLVFKDDWVYVYELARHLGSDEEYDEKITRYSLDGKKKEEVFSFRAKGAGIINVQAYENQLFFTIRQAATEEQDSRIVVKEVYHGLFVYQESTKSVGKVIDKNVVDYCVDSKNNIIYYFELEKGLHRYDVTTENDDIIYEADDSCMMAFLSCDGENIYIDNSQWVSYAKRLPVEKKIDRKLIVLDLSGRKVGGYDCPEIVSMYFGDKDKLFADIVYDNVGWCVSYADKSSLTGSGKINWQRLK